jgi:RNA polymerase sigma factor (sigma-70 family)
MTQELDPVALLGGCRDGAPAERREAYQILGSFLLRVALDRLRSKPDLRDHAEECVQEALVSIWRKLEAGGGPDQPERFLSWSAAVVVHKTYDLLRRQGYVRGAIAEPAPAGKEAGRSTSRARGSEGRAPAIPAGRKRVPRSAQHSLDALLEGGPSGDDRPVRLPDPTALAPEAEAARREAFVDLVLAIRDHPRLSEHSKQVLSQGFLAELDDAELAQRLGLARGNIHVIRCRNLAKLRGDAEFLALLAAQYDGFAAQHGESEEE